MGFTPDQFREMQERTAKNSRKRVPESASIPAALVQPVTAVWPWPVLPLLQYDLKEFNYTGMPVGKPRQTQRDTWAKRPCVMRYRAFADGLRAAAGSLPPLPDAVFVTAYIPMPASWPQKKKDALNCQPCRQKPDWDNIGKAVCDSLFKEDAGIWLGLTIKFWCREGQEGLNIKILYAKPS